jgi:DNA-binding transcriptional regulator LsrR (DeoR family)
VRVTTESRQAAADKADRALKLHEQGLGRWLIAERLGVPPKNVNGMLQRAKQRRERAEAANVTA